MNKVSTGDVINTIIISALQKHGYYIDKDKNMITVKDLENNDEAKVTIDYIDKSIEEPTGAELIKDTTIIIGSIAFLIFIIWFIQMWIQDI